MSAHTLARTQSEAAAAAGTAPVPNVVASAGPPPPAVLAALPPPPETASASAPDDDGSDSEYETMYVAIDLPKGAKVPTDFSIDQLEGLHTARPTLNLNGRSHAGKVDVPIGTHYFFRQNGPDPGEDQAQPGEKRARDDPSGPDPAAVDPEKFLEYAGRIDRIISFD